MQRWTRTLKLLAAIVFGSAAVWAQLPVKEISGRVAPNEVRISSRHAVPHQRVPT